MKKLFFILFLFSCSEIRAQNVRLFQYTSNASGTCQIWNLAQNINTGALFYCRSIPPSTAWTPIPVGTGAVNIGLAGLTTNGISYADTTATLVSTAALSNGQLLIGNTGNPPSLNTLTAGTGIAVGNGAGTVTVSTSGIPSSSLSITTTTCTNQFISAISATGIGTCSTITLASAQFANQGTVTTLLHGNAAGNPSFTSITSTDLGTTLTPQFGNVKITGAGLANLDSDTPNLWFTNSGSSNSLEIRLDNSAVGSGRKWSIISDDSGKYRIRDTTGAVDYLTISPTINAIGGAASSGDQFRITGSPGSGVVDGINMLSTITPGNNQPGWGIVVQTTFVKDSAGTHPKFAGISVELPAVTAGGSALTNYVGVDVTSFTAPASTSIASGVRIAGPTTATTNWALNITSGDSNFAGKIYGPGLTNANAQDYVCYNTTSKELEQNVTTCNLSTEAVKHNINLITSKESLDIVKQMQPVSFVLNIHPELGERIGFTAQRTEPIDKRLVTYFKDGSLRSVDYMGYTAILTGAVQEHDIEIQLLKNRIIELERKVN